MIKSAIFRIVHTRLLTTTAVVAKLAVCAVLLAGIESAQAAKNDGAGKKDAARRPAAHVALKKPLATKDQTAKKLSARKSDRSKSGHAKADQAKLARLERDWKRLHSRRQVGLLSRLVACREYGRCEGLKIHPTLGAALIRVSPERPGLGAAVAAAPEKEAAPARGIYAAAKAKKPLVSAKLRSRPSPAARIRSAAADADGSDAGGASLLYGGASPVNP